MNLSTVQVSTLAEFFQGSQVKENSVNLPVVFKIVLLFGQTIIIWPEKNKTLNMIFMYSDITDHSRNLMSSEDLKIEQIGTHKSELSALLIEGIYASRSQN